MMLIENKGSGSVCMLIRSVRLLRSEKLVEMCLSSGAPLILKQIQQNYRTIACQGADIRFHQPRKKSRKNVIRFGKPLFQHYSSSSVL